MFTRPILIQCIWFGCCESVWSNVPVIDLSLCLNCFVLNFKEIPSQRITCVGVFLSLMTETVSQWLAGTFLMPWNRHAGSSVHGSDILTCRCQHQWHLLVPSSAPWNTCVGRVGPSSALPCSLLMGLREQTSALWPHQQAQHVSRAQPTIHVCCPAPGWALEHTAAPQGHPEQLLSHNLVYVPLFHIAHAHEIQNPLLCYLPASLSTFASQSSVSIEWYQIVAFGNMTREQNYKPCAACHNWHGCVSHSRPQALASVSGILKKECMK